MIDGFRVIVRMGWCVAVDMLILCGRIYRGDPSNVLDVFLYGSGVCDVGNSIDVFSVSSVKDYQSKGLQCDFVGSRGGIMGLSCVGQGRVGL